MDVKFLDYYFSSCIKARLRNERGNAIKLADFKPPTNKNNKTTYKTINTEYIELVKHSSLFMKDL